MSHSKGNNAWKSSRFLGSLYQSFAFGFHSSGSAVMNSHSYQCREINSWKNEHKAFSSLSGPRLSFFSGCFLLALLRFVVTTVLMLQLILILMSPSHPTLMSRSSIEEEGSSSSPSSLISLQESSTIISFPFYSFSSSSILVDAGIMKKMKKKIKDKKCVPEIVAIKKTRIVPVAVPVKSLSMPDAYLGKASPSGSSSYSSSSSSSSKKNEEEDGGYNEEEDEEETVEGTYAEEDDDAEGYEGDDNDGGYEIDTDAYKRRFGEVQDNMTSEASAFNQKIGEIMLSDKIFRQTFENPPVASNPLIDLLVSRKNQADEKHNRESNFIGNTVNPLQQRIDTQIQVTPHYDFHKTAIDQELK